VTPNDVVKGLAMTKATLDQASKILDLCRDLKISSDDLQAAISTGALTDVLTSPNLWAINRDEHRRVLGHTSLAVKSSAHVIDVGVKPFCPEGWKVVLPCGKNEWREADDSDFMPGQTRLDLYSNLPHNPRWTTINCYRSR
jgi:hypothetical protein